MDNEKKKTIIVIALGAVMLAVGAFNFLPKGAPAKPVKAASQQSTVSAKPADVAVNTVVNPQFSNPLPDRDPFAKPAEVIAAENAKSQPPKMITPRSLGGSSLHGSLPAPNGTAMNGFSGNLQVAPISPASIPFSYSLSGVILGKTPAAVFSDSAGNQRLVPIGGSLDGDTTLERVTSNAVTVRYHGETIHLSLGTSLGGNK